MPTDPTPTVDHPLLERLSRPLPRVLVYLLLTALVMGGAAWSPTDATVGIPSIDSLDTTMLRALTADAVLHGRTTSDLVFFPTGTEVFQLTPNLLDHLTALPLVRLLPFPLADNLWWALMLLANALAAHWMGVRLGGSQGAGWLAGVALLTADAVLREANLHHAPQVMLAWAPILVGLAVHSSESRESSDKQAGLAAVCLAVGALAYWYAGLFAVLAFAPLLVRQKPRHLAIGAVLIVLVCAPFLAPQLLDWDTRPLTSGATLAPPRGVHESFTVLPEADQFIAWHGTDPLFWLRDVTTDTSNRVPIALLVAASLGARRWAPRERRALLWAAMLATAMVLGPVLRWGDAVVTVGEHAIALPFAAFRAVHPFFERLTWPERWGWVLPVALIALASRAPRPGLFALAVLVENALLSANLPLQHNTIRHETCWAALSGTEGAVLEMPLDRGLRAARAAVHGRMHGRPVVNPVLLPPGARPPDDWHDWSKSMPLMQYLGSLERGRSPDDPGAAAVESFREAGITVIALDVEPGASMRASRQNRIRAILGRHLGPPIDLGCALVWWLDPSIPAPPAHPDGKAWRAEAEAWKEAHPAPELDVLIQPMWDDIRSPSDRQRP